MKKIKSMYRKLPDGFMKKTISRIYNSKSKMTNNPKFPSYVQIEPTTRCNLNCIMCMRSDFLGSGIMKNGDMSFDNFKKILDNIPSTNELDIQGVGEPFMNADIFKMIRYAKSKKIKVHTVTNATIIGKYAEKIVKSGIDALKISLYGASPDIYENIMKNANMEKTISNIIKIKNVKKKLNSKNPLLEMTIGVMKENIEDIENIAELAKRIGINKIILGEIYGHGKPILMNNNTTKRVVKNIRSECKKMGVEFSVNIPKNIYDYTKKCLWPWVATYITWEGEVKPCCSRPYFSRISFGNVIENKFENIWNNEKYVEFRKKLRSNNVPKLCNGCQYDFSVFGDENEK